MKNKLMKAAYELNRKSRSKSKDRSFPKNKLTVQHKQQQKPQIYSSPIITKLVESFTHQILNPIMLHTQIYNFKGPQKCLQHNNISTLYCVNDGRPLCASCMYQSSIHKSHKIIPLIKATSEMKNDIKENLLAVDQYLKFAAKIMEKNVQNLQRGQKQFPSIMQKIHDNYMELHQLLVSRKDQQLKLFHDMWSRIRYENYTMRAELTRMSDFMNERIKQIKRRQQDEDSLIYNSNLAFHLAKIQNILYTGIVKKETNNFEAYLKKFRRVFDNVKQNLVFSNETTAQNMTISPKMQKKNSKSSLKKEHFPKKIDKQQTDLTIQQRLQQYNNRQNGKQEIQRQIPKNRHSVKQVTLKEQLSIKKIQYQSLKNRNKTKSAVSHIKSKIRESNLQSPKKLKEDSKFILNKSSTSLTKKQVKTPVKTK